ncbi:MAG: vitamin K epoxide reductase family protein [Actinomycetaceae bacterium]|nr:vitamin K epoxide reductase family protein [Actinomycetaceae bacterium]
MVEEAVEWADPLAPTKHEQQGGAKPTTAGAMSVLSAIGAIASAMLIRSEYIHATQPDASLACDLNPLLGCSSSLTSVQAHLFGVPNALLGLLAFCGLVGIGIALMARVRLPRWLWWALAAGCGAALVWVAWFLNQSVTIFRSLCPYCLTVWAVTIPLTCLVWTHLLRTSRPGETLSGPRRLLVQSRWFLVVLVYVAIVAIIVVGLADKVARVL